MTHSGTGAKPVLVASGGSKAGWLGGDLATVVSEMRRLGILELSERQRRIVLGPEPLSVVTLPVSPDSAPEDSAEAETEPPVPDLDRYSASGMRVPPELRRMLLARVGS